MEQQKKKPKIRHNFLRNRKEVDACVQRYQQNKKRINAQKMKTTADTHSVLKFKVPDIDAIQKLTVDDGNDMIALSLLHRRTKVKMLRDRHIRQNKTKENVSTSKKNDEKTLIKLDENVQKKQQPLCFSNLLHKESIHIHCQQLMTQMATTDMCRRLVRNWKKQTVLTNQHRPSDSITFLLMYITLSPIQLKYSTRSFVVFGDPQPILQLMDSFHVYGTNRANCLSDKNKLSANQFHILHRMMTTEFHFAIKQAFLQNCFVEMKVSQLEHESESVEGYVHNDLLDQYSKEFRMSIITQFILQMLQNSSDCPMNLKFVLENISKALHLSQLMLTSHYYISLQSTRTATLSQKIDIIDSVLSLIYELQRRLKYSILACSHSSQHPWYNSTFDSIIQQMFKFSQSDNVTIIKKLNIK